MSWGAASLLALVIAAQTYPPPFPRQNATKLLENEHLVIWDIVWPKGEPTALHRHVYDQLGTYYQSGGRVITTPDGETRRTTTEVGRISTTRKGTLHIEEGSTDTPLRAVFIELKHERPYATASANSVGGTPFHAGASRVFDDERATVWDVTLRAGESLRYRAAREVVVVWVTPGVVHFAERGLTASTQPITAGRMHHAPPDTPLDERVVEGPMRAIVFEMK